MEEFPWTGEYFGGIANKLTAISINPNYEFDFWSLDNHTVYPSDTLDEVTLLISMEDNIVAHFKPKILVDSLIINEINYNSANDIDPGDWVEFYNSHNYDLNITGWQFKDENDSHVFTFPQGTIIEAQNYLVLCRDSIAFNSIFPDVENYIGEMDFGLSSGGELIRLFDDTGYLVDTVHYDNNSPWPTEPDGNGPTLELLNWSLDNALPESWAASEDHGTPGEENSMITNVPKLNKAFATLSFTIYPNPFKTSAIIQVTSESKITDGEIIIYNVFGKVIKRIENINSNRIEIFRDGLPKGIYICKLFDSKNNVNATRKLMVE